VLLNEEIGCVAFPSSPGNQPDDGKHQEVDYECEQVDGPHSFIFTFYSP